MWSRRCTTPPISTDTSHLNKEEQVNVELKVHTTPTISTDTSHLNKEEQVNVE